MKTLGKVTLAIILTLVSILFIIFLSSRGAFAKSSAEPLLYEGRMKYAGRSVNKSGTWLTSVWIDKKTGVCYLDNGDGVTVLIDRNGDPYIANGWRDYDG